MAAYLMIYCTAVSIYNLLLTGSCKGKREQKIISILVMKKEAKSEAESKEA